LQAKGVRAFTITLSRMQVMLLKKFEKISASNVYWSPRGQYCVCASLNTPAGKIHDPQLVHMRLL
jgi:hypothetical protein